MSRELVDAVLGSAAEKPITQVQTRELKQLFTTVGHRRFVTSEAFVNAAYAEPLPDAGAAVFAYLRESDPDQARRSATVGWRTLIDAGDITARAVSMANTLTPGGAGAARARRTLEGSGVLSAREEGLVRRHHHVLHTLAHSPRGQRRELIERLHPDHVRVVGAAVRYALHGGAIPMRLLETRGRMLEHMANPRASLRVKHRHLHSNPGVVAAALRAVV